MGYTKFPPKNVLCLFVLQFNDVENEFDFLSLLCASEFRLLEIENDYMRGKSEISARKKKICVVNLCVSHFTVRQLCSNCVIH